MVDANAVFMTIAAVSVFIYAGMAGIALLAGIVRDYYLKVRNG